MRNKNANPIYVQSQILTVWTFRCFAFAVIKRIRRIRCTVVAVRGVKLIQEIVLGEITGGTLPFSRCALKREWGYVNIWPVVLFCFLNSLDIMSGKARSSQIFHTSIKIYIRGWNYMPICFEFRIATWAHRCVTVEVKSWSIKL